MVVTLRRFLFLLPLLLWTTFTRAQFNQQGFGFSLASGPPPVCTPVSMAFTATTGPISTPTACNTAVASAWGAGSNGAAGSTISPGAQSGASGSYVQAGTYGSGSGLTSFPTSFYVTIQSAGASASTCISSASTCTGTIFIKAIAANGTTGGSGSGSCQAGATCTIHGGNSSRAAVSGTFAGQGGPGAPGPAGVGPGAGTVTTLDYAANGGGGSNGASSTASGNASTTASAGGRGTAGASAPGGTAGTAAAAPNATPPSGGGGGGGGFGNSTEATAAFMNGGAGSMSPDLTATSLTFTGTVGGGGGGAGGGGTALASTLGGSGGNASPCGGGGGSGGASGAAGGSTTGGTGGVGCAFISFPN